ncbi:MAG: 1-acyl-sn-glycerol-3-phosphate acyltransferase [Bacteroidales bacterium]|nr:1-acyl-sn-glycerol-3-phosphate acyltransferase [Bacteroidales bacterium]
MCKEQTSTPFVPQTGIDYPSDPSAKIVPVGQKYHDFVFDATYPYLDDSFDYKYNRFLCYAGLWSFAFLLNRLIHGLRVHGRKNIRQNRKLFRSGAMAVCNHVYRWDALCVLDAIRYRTVKVPMFSGHFLGKDLWFLRSIGGIPIPEDRGGLMKFNEAFDEYHRRGEWILAYPEAARWDFYAPIRPFHTGVFNMAWKYKIPVVPMVISYRERKGLYKLFGKGPCVDITVGTPILPSAETPRKVEVARLRDEAHEQMVRMAGWEGKNPWPSHLD